MAAVRTNKPTLEDQLGDAAELDGLEDEDLASLSLVPAPDVVIDADAPLRLGAGERQLLHLLSGALRTSDYTDKVDHVNPGYRSYSFGSRSYGYGGGGMNRGKAGRIKAQLDDVLCILLGLQTACNFRVGNALVAGRSLQACAPFFRRVFEVGRRHKIMNPAKMRDTYGKMMCILQDASGRDVRHALGFSLRSPVRTVRGLLEARGATHLLDEGRALKLAICAPSDAAGAAAKRGAIETLVAAYGTRLPARASASSVSSASSASSAAVAAPDDDDEGKDEGAAGMTPDEVRLVLSSLADASVHAAMNTKPIEAMIRLLKANFDPRSAKSSKLSLAIRKGHEGSCLTHDHPTQYTFALQSLSLWLEVCGNLTELWNAAEDDLLSESNAYRLCDTGQGFNRLQPAPAVGRAMSEILSRVQRACGRWVGLSVVHLGDRDVPNALVFIDKYAQVARIVHPVVSTVEHLPVVARGDQAVALYIEKTFGSVAQAQHMILRDFFRHAFDGSGDDGGSCIDGRLTSAWNWCNLAPKKPYWPLFSLTNFESFDGDFK